MIHRNQFLVSLFVWKLFYLVHHICPCVLQTLWKQFLITWFPTFQWGHGSYYAQILLWKFIGSMVALSFPNSWLQCTNARILTLNCKTCTKTRAMNKVLGFWRVSLATPYLKATLLISFSTTKLLFCGHCKTRRNFEGNRARPRSLGSIAGHGNEHNDCANRYGMCDF